MKTRRLILLLTTVLLSHFIMAQTSKIISGIVRDSDNKPIPSVTVTIQGTSTSVITNENGNYQITVSNAGSSLIFSAIGYETTNIAVGTAATIDVTLLSKSNELEGVVVTALGIKRQKKELGYSTAQVKGSELVQSSAPNIANAISGKVSGVQIVQPNGVEGGTTRIVIRGNNSFTGDNQPLIIVDGMPFENSPGMTSMINGKDWGSALNNINTNDIETMDVLKGPNAAALYGARGANGVIIITTKKGGARKGIGIDYAVDHRMIQPWLYRDVQNVYGTGGAGIGDVNPTLPQNSAGKNILPYFIDWGTGLGWGMGFGNHGELAGRNSWDLFSWYGPAVSWGAKMEGQEVIWWDGKTRNYDPQPNNLKSFYKNGSTTTHNVSFGKASDFGSIRVSLTRMDNDAVDYNSKANQTTFNLGGNLKISSKLTANFGISYINYNRKNAPELGESDRRQQNGRISSGKYLLYNMGRDYQPIDKNIYQNPDGSQNQFWVKPAGANYSGFNDVDGYGYVYDYWWRIWNNNQYLKRDKLLGTVNLMYDITNWLSVTGRFASDLTFDLREQKNKPTSLDGISGGYYEKLNGSGKVYNTEVLVTAKKDNIINKVNASISIGGANWSREDLVNGAATGPIAGDQTFNQWLYPWSYALTNVKNNSSLRLTESTYRKKLRSTYGMLNISYDNYLFLQITGRRDISSTLPRSSNAYFFPSSSLSFVFTDAIPSLKNDFLSFGKLRVSYAEAATDAAPYLTQYAYSPGSFNSQLGIYLPGTGGNTTMDNNVPPVSLKNATNRGIEGGLSLGLLKDKLNFDLAVYANKSFNQIFNSPIPASSGATTFTVNNGSIKNSGVELTIDYKAIENRNFVWDIGLRASKNKNKVIDIGNEAEFIELQSLWDQYGPSIRLKKGDQFGTIYGYKIQRNSKGEKIVTNDGTRYLVEGTKTPIGNVTPKALVGLTNTFKYKNFILSTLIDCKIGGDMYSGTYAYSLLTGQSPETLKERMGGGLPYTDANGQTRNVGITLDGVNENGGKNTQVVHYLWKYMGNLGAGWGDWSLPDGRRFFFNNEAAVFDNSYVKLREVSLSYNIPLVNSVFSKVVQNVNVYITGRDLFYIYKNAPDNINPEGANGAGNAQGFEWGALPGMRSFSFGAKIGF